MVYYKNLEVKPRNSVENNDRDAEASEDGEGKIEQLAIRVKTEEDAQAESLLFDLFDSVLSLISLFFLS